MTWTDARIIAILESAETEISWPTDLISRHRS